MTSRRTHRYRRSTLAGALLLATGACGNLAPNAPAADTERSEIGWSTQTLGAPPGPDDVPLLAQQGAESIVATVTEDEQLVGWARIDSGPFQRGAATNTGRELLQLTAADRRDDGWYALAVELATFVPSVFRAEDGRTWERVDSSGLDTPAEPNQVIALDDGTLAAVGTVRTADDLRLGGFRPAAWRSADGRSWGSVTVPGAGEGIISGMVRAGYDLFAVGSLRNRPAWWRSADTGRSWHETTPAGLDGITSVGDVVASADTLLMAASGRGSEYEASGLVRSTDGGASWSVVQLPEALTGVEPLQVAAAAGRFFVVQDRFLDPFDDPELCYADPAFCQSDPVSIVLMSRDGVRWDRVDMNGIGVDQYTNIAGVIGAGPDHVTVIVQGNRLVAYTSAVADLQVTEPERRPGEPDVMVVEWGADLKLGQRYGYPLFTHCGIEWLGEFNGNTWKLDQSEPHDEEAGGGGMIYGYVLLTADDRIEYSDAEGTLVGVYRPTTEPQPPCA